MPSQKAIVDKNSEINDYVFIGEENPCGSLLDPDGICDKILLSKIFSSGKSYKRTTRSELHPKKINKGFSTKRTENRSPALKQKKQIPKQNSKIDESKPKKIIKAIQKSKNEQTFLISDLAYKERIYLIKDEISEIVTSIWIAENKSQILAVKKYTYKKEELTKKYEKEAYFLDTLSQVSHPFFLKFYEFEKTLLEGQFEFCLVMEYCPSSLHRQILEKIALGENSNLILVVIVNKLLSGFVKLSKSNIVHRDIKPQNILFSEDKEYKLIDYGISENVPSMSEEGEYFIKGTRDYMSPELISELNKNNQKCVKFKYNLEKADVYSLGLVFLKICTGKSVKGINQIAYQEEMCEILNEIKIKWLRKTLEKMLLLDPAKRFTFEEAYEYLQEDDDFKKDLNQAYNS